MNHLTIAGHLGVDPEVRFTSSNQKVTTLRVAARVRRGSKDETVWWRVTVWGEQFDKMIAYLKKGSAVIVFGEMDKPEIFTDRNGNSQVSMNVTASNLMFSPFGRSTQENSPIRNNNDNVSNNTDSSIQKNQDSFGGITTGTQPVEKSGFSNDGNSFQPDDEIPF